MIRHCVFLRFSTEVSRAERDALYAGLDGLRAELPGMLSFKAGPNVSPEGLAKGFEEGFVADFLDAAARDAYLANATHQALGARIAAATEGGGAGILVFDLAL
jgi:Stress responsive A/B Barrel Domain